MIQAGTYKAKAIGGEFGTSKNKGTDFVRVTSVVSDGDAKGASVSWDGYFTEKTQQRTIESLRYCGCEFPSDDITDLLGIDRNEVSIVVEHQQWTNDKGEEKEIARVAWVNSLAGQLSEETRMDQGKRQSFAQRLKGAVMVVKSKTPGVSGATTNGAAPPPAVAASTNRRDDIPF